ncbi:MAG: hypothetical protein ACKOQS_12870, partial [Dolichospermum sp.]
MSVVSGQWLVVKTILNKGRRTTDNEQRTTDNEQRTTDNGQRTTNNEQRTTNNEQRTTNNEQRTTDNEQRTCMQNHIVLITGASSGIGAACAKIFAHAGAKLI